MKLSARCYAVTGLGYATPWCVNAGFVVGDDVTLIIDTGANTLAAQTIHGYATAVRSTNRLQVVNTEKHFDHIGGNGFFRKHGVEVWGHAGIRRTEAEFQAEIAGLTSAFFHDTQVTNPNRQVHDSMTFDLGNCEAHVLFTPGHTPTNISVWIPEDRVLYTGDCLIREYMPNLDTATPDDWLRSLDRIEALQPAIVLAGHGPVAVGSEVHMCIQRVRRALI